MNNKEYIAELARQTGYSQEDAQKLVRKVIDAMISQFEEGEAVAIPNLELLRLRSVWSAWLSTPQPRSVSSYRPSWYLPFVL